VNANVEQSAVVAQQNGIHEPDSTSAASSSTAVVVEAPAVVVPPMLPGSTIDLNRFDSAKDVESVGLDELKEELFRLGLLCGGNLQQRAERLFSLKGKKSFSEIDPKLFAKPKFNHKK